MAETREERRSVDGERLVNLDEHTVENLRRAASKLSARQSARACSAQRYCSIMFVHVGVIVNCREPTFPDVGSPKLSIRIPDCGCSRPKLEAYC